MSSPGGSASEERRNVLANAAEQRRYVIFMLEYKALSHLEIGRNVTMYFMLGRTKHGLLVEMLARM